MEKRLTVLEIVNYSRLVHLPGARAFQSGRIFNRYGLND
jgi:hypothetical protein